MDLQIIEQLLAPVVLISACGLLGMAQYSRLTAIVVRIRQFNHERHPREAEAGEVAHLLVLVPRSLHD